MDETDTDETFEYTPPQGIAMTYPAQFKMPNLPLAAPGQLRDAALRFLRDDDVSALIAVRDMLLDAGRDTDARVLCQRFGEAAVGVTSYCPPPGDHLFNFRYQLMALLFNDIFDYAASVGVVAEMMTPENRKKRKEEYDEMMRQSIAGVQGGYITTMPNDSPVQMSQHFGIGYTGGE